MNTNLIQPFLNSTKDIITQMAEINISWEDGAPEEGGEFLSNGISSIITFAGKIKGRFLLDMDIRTALDIAGKITGETFNNIKDHMVLAAISELNNIIAGDAITALNNLHSLELRLAPPVVMTGKDVVVVIPKLKSASVKGFAGQSNIKVNIAFEGGA